MINLSGSQLSCISGGTSFAEDITALAATAHLGFVTASISTRITAACLNLVTLGYSNPANQILSSAIGLATPFIIAANVFDKHPEHLVSLKETYAKYF